MSVIIITIIIWALSILRFSLAYFTYQLDFFYIFGSDATYPAVLINDIFSQHGSYSKWYMPNVPFYIPDLMMYLVVWLFTKKIYWASYFFITSQITLGLFAFYLLLKKFFQTELALFFAVIGFYWVVALGLKGVQPYNLIFSIVYHFGALILLFLEYCVLIDYIREPRPSKKRQILLFTLTFISIVSDRILLVQFMLPALIIGFYFYVRDEINFDQLKKLLFIFAGAYLSATFFLKWIQPHASIPRYSWGVNRIHETIDILTQSIYTLKEHRILLIFFVVYAFFSSMLFVGNGPQKIFEQFSKKYKLMFMLVIMSGLVPLVVIFCSSHGVNLRYLIPFYTAPMLFFLPCVYLIFKAVISENVFLILASMVFFIFAWPVVAPKKIQVEDFHFDYYPNEIQCVDTFLKSRGVHFGVTDYWTAKKTQALSKEGITLAQYDEFFYTPVYSEINEDFFKQTYQFALLVKNESGTFQREALDLLKDKNYGILKSHNCGSLLIYYNESFKLKLRPRPRSKI